MNIAWDQLELGMSEELENRRLQKEAVLPVVALGLGAAAFGPPTVAQIGKTFFPESHRRWSQTPNNPYSVAEMMRKGLVGATAVGSEALKAPARINSLVDKLPGVIDNIGKFAPLAMGAMILPSLMNRNQQQGAAGQPVVVNNYLGGQKPSMISPMQGVNSLTNPLPKMGEFLQKKADIISEALATAAKRRMANKVLDVVSPENIEPDEKESRNPEELEVITKYPQIAKMLQDEENKAYLNRLLKG